MQAILWGIRRRTSWKRKAHSHTEGRYKVLVPRDLLKNAIQLWIPYTSADNTQVCILAHNITHISLIVVKYFILLLVQVFTGVDTLFADIEPLILVGPYIRAGKTGMEIITVDTLYREAGVVGTHSLDYTVYA